MTSELLTEMHARPILGYRLEAEEHTARRIFLKALRSIARRNRVNSRRYRRFYCGGGVPSLGRKTPPFFWAGKRAKGPPPGTKPGPQTYRAIARNSQHTTRCHSS